MATPEADAHLRRLHYLRRQHMSTDLESSKENLIRQLQRPPPPPRSSERLHASSDRRRRGHRRSHAMKKRSRQQMVSMKGQHQPPQMQRPKYIDLKDTCSLTSSTSFSTSSVSIGPPKESPSNIQTYRNYINELSNRLQEGDYAYAEELDLNDSMPQTSQYQQDPSLESRSRSHRGSAHYNGRVKDSMIEKHYHQSTRGETDADFEESSFNDEEAYLPMNPPSPSHQRLPNNNFFIPSHVKLNPRANLYLLILLTCIIAISSLVVGNGRSTPRSSSERAALFFSSTSLLIAMTIGFSFRYAPLRIYITRPYSFFEWILGQLIDSREKACGIVLLMSTIILCGIVMQPRANLAVASNYNVLNSSLFYSTWVSVYTCMIIVADMFTQDESHWIIARACNGDGGIVPSSGYPSVRSTALKAWLVALFTNLAVSGTLYSACSSGVYEIYRTKVLVSGFLGIFNGLIAALLLALYHMVSMAQERAHSYGTWNSKWEGPNSQKHLNSVGLGLGMVVLVLNCTIVALISPLGPGSIVLPCWVAFIMSIFLCKQYVESSLVTQPHFNNLSKDIDMCSHSDRSKGTQTTLESNYVDSCDEVEEDGDTSIHSTNERRPHDELMDRLRTLSASVAGQKEPEEEICSPGGANAAPPTERTQQEPEEEVLPDTSKDTISLSTKTPTQASKGRPDPVEYKIKPDTISGKCPPSQRFPPPPPPPPPPFEKIQAECSSGGESTCEPIGSAHQRRKSRRKSKRASSRTDDFVSLSGKSPAAVDALVADALRHARKVKETPEVSVSETEESYIQDMFRRHRQLWRRRSCGVMSDSDESSEQRRARRIEISNLLKKVDSEFRSPSHNAPHVTFPNRSKGHSASSDGSKEYSSS
eukprot:scaffold32_cov144-Skeletonema_menzelii.AAC.3